MKGKLICAAPNGKGNSNRGHETVQYVLPTHTRSPSLPLPLFSVYSEPATSEETE